MADDQRHPKLQQRRTGDGGGDDVIRDRRDAHAKDDAGDHGQDQRQDQAFIADMDDELAKGRGDAGQGHGADDDTDQRAGDTDGQRGLGPFGQRVAAQDQRLAPALRQRVPADQHDQRGQNRHDPPFEEGRRDKAKPDPDEDTQRLRRQAEDDRPAKDQQDRQRQPDGACEQGRVTAEQEVDQHAERQEEIPVLSHRFQGRGQVFLGHADKAVAPGLEMHHPEGAEEVEDGGDQRRLHHLDIVHAQRFGHDEGDRTHDRRHDLPAHGGGGFHAPREGRPVAEAFHQRDGELPRGHDIRDAGTRDRPHQAGRDHRDLRRAALLVADKAKRDIGEQLDHPRAFQERAEEDEEEDIG